MLFVMLLCLKTHSRRWKVLSFKIKVESLLNGRTRPVTPISRKQTAVHFSLCNQICGPVLHGRKQQPTTGFMAVVSGGRQVSRMDDCQRDFTLPSCALTHTVLPRPCSRWLIFFFTAVCPCSSGGTAANKKRGNSAFKYYVNTIQNAVGYEFLLICSHFWKLQVIKHAATMTCINTLNELT